MANRVSVIFYYGTDVITNILQNILKQPGRHALLNNHIHIAGDPTPVDVDHAARECHCIVRPHGLLGESWRPTYFKLYIRVSSL